MVFVVAVDVALRRPPRTDATVFFILEAETRLEAERVACQMVFVRENVVMPVASRSMDKVLYDHYGWEN
jgi:hypothetical protein